MSGAAFRSGRPQLHPAAPRKALNSGVCDQLWRAQLNSPIWDDIHRRMRMDRYWKVWLNDHEQIFAAIKLGSSIQARIEMVKHLENVRQALLANSGSASR